MTRAPALEPGVGGPCLRTERRLEVLVRHHYAQPLEGLLAAQCWRQTALACRPSNDCGSHGAGALCQP
eukprot:CAMPEP_0171134976 /NCGR_PEP_ID=MMETSP0766_2-20121228/128993_1 /TAXON_ID=439317 /ORGANISM="Gambierdiscus australes, Strain CAWD 149" /LENGTH=67 /DNA_ID=CAMNT_0011598455 /DNA_START=116 /DNA_END=316 /DNA_ORIENTATION=+